MKFWLLFCCLFVAVLSQEFYNGDDDFQYARGWNYPWWARGYPWRFNRVPYRRFRYTQTPATQRVEPIAKVEPVAPTESTPLTNSLPTPSNPVARPKREVLRLVPGPNIIRVPFYHYPRHPGFRHRHDKFIARGKRQISPFVPRFPWNPVPHFPRPGPRFPDTFPGPFNPRFPNFPRNPFEPRFPFNPFPRGKRDVKPGRRVPKLPCKLHLHTEKPGFPRLPIITNVNHDLPMIRGKRDIKLGSFPNFPDLDLPDLDLPDLYQPGIETPEIPEQKVPRKEAPSVHSRRKRQQPGLNWVGRYGSLNVNGQINPGRVSNLNALGRVNLAQLGRNTVLQGYGTVDKTWGVPSPLNRPQFGGGLTLIHRFG